MRSARIFLSNCFLLLRKEEDQERRNMGRKTPTSRWCLPIRKARPTEGFSRLPLWYFERWNFSSYVSERCRTLRRPQLRHGECPRQSEMLPTSAEVGAGAAALLGEEEVVVDCRITGVAATPVAPEEGCRRMHFKQASDRPHPNPPKEEVQPPVGAVVKRSTVGPPPRASSSLPPRLDDKFTSPSTRRPSAVCFTRSSR